MPDQQIPEEKKDTELRCIYGNKIKIKNLSTSEVSEYTLVTLTEEKPGENKISNYTEVGKAVWAKKEGDEVEIAYNHKKQKFKIIEIDQA
ncbi:MAG: GreA/GreB family elongation factor [Deltaproteobacteria bacterium]|nr:GreA/GreB family elongation factor [Deltaproteobacteria bacterium]